MTHLKLIKDSDRGDEIVACPVCDSTTLLPVVVGSHRIGSGPMKGEILGGSDQLICAQCLAEGEVRVVADDVTIEP